LGDFAFPVKKKPRVKRSASKAKRRSKKQSK
jgi:hypothetical protein